MKNLKLFFFVSLLVSVGLAWTEPSLRSLTLKEALQLAVINHPTLAGGRAGIEIQEGSEIQTRSAELPQILFNSNFERANSRGSAFGSGSSFTNYDTHFQLNQLIFDFGKTYELIEASHQQVLQARDTLQYDYQQVLFGVYQTYYQLLEAKATVKVDEDSVANLRQHLDQAQTFFTVGTQPKIDVTQAQVNLSNGLLTLVQGQNAYAIAKTNLKAAMGVIDFPPFEVTENLEEPPNYSITLEDAVQRAYQHRPDLQALLAQQKGAEASLSAARKGYYPEISGTAANGWIGPTLIPPPNSQSWQFGVQFSVPIFNGLLTQGQIVSAKGTLDSVTAQVDNLKLTVRQSVEQAYNNLTSGKTSLQQARDALTYAEENFELANGQYKVGTGNYLQFTDAQVSLVQARSNLIQALGNYNIYIAAIEQSMGTLKGASEEP